MRWDRGDIGGDKQTSWTASYYTKGMATNNKPLSLLFLNVVPLNGGRMILPPDQKPGNSRRTFLPLTRTDRSYCCCSAPLINWQREQRNVKQFRDGLWNISEEDKNISIRSKTSSWIIPISLEFDDSASSPFFFCLSSQAAWVML